MTSFGAGRRRMNAVVPPSISNRTSPAVADAERDIDVLARTLYGEARAGRVRVKEAIAAVVMNRVRRAKERGGYWWGSSVAEVCRRPWQFACWNPGSTARARLEALDAGNATFRSCLRITRRAIRGALKDPTAGATHYHDRDANPHWARGRAPAAEIGGRAFYNDIE